MTPPAGRPVTLTPSVAVDPIAELVGRLERIESTLSRLLGLVEDAVSVLPMPWLVRLRRAQAKREGKQTG